MVPLALVGILYLAAQRPKFLRIALPLVAAANLLLPATHVLTAFKVPIFYLYTEIDRWQNPPACLNPIAYVKNGVQLANQKKYDLAEPWYDNALKLDAAFGAAYAARAFTRLKLGHLEGAVQDAEQAVSCNPHDPDAYFIRALIRLRCHNRVDAASDLRTAMRIAPAEWPHRQEGQRMLAELNLGQGE